MKPPAAAIRIKASDDAQGVRRTATLILAGLFGVFLVTHIPEDPSYWILLIRAMAEAGMIGGLADWFAVEALFRKPLGLPIPHTALLPSNQKRAATNIARFIDEYFLGPQQLTAQIRSFDPLRAGLNWLRTPTNRTDVAREMSWAIRILAKSQFKGEVPDPIRKLVARALRKAATSGNLSDHIVVLMKDALNSQILDKTLGAVRATIDDNRPAFSELIQERSRWWISKGVDRQVTNTLVEGVLSILDELSDPNSPKRHRFANSIQKVMDRVQNEGAIATYFEDSLSDYEKSRDFQRTVDQLLSTLIAQIEHRLDAHPDDLEDAISNALEDLVDYLDNNAESRAAIEARIEAGLIGLFATLRQPIRDYISDTISNWDSVELVMRIESEVSRDLQFIRINGSVLGALLGGTIFVFSHLLL